MIVHLDLFRDDQIIVKASVNQVHFLRQIDSFRYKIIGSEVIGFVYFNLDILKTFSVLPFEIKLSDSLKKRIEEEEHFISMLKEIKRDSSYVDFKFKTPLLPFQIKPLNYILHLNKCALYLDMGLGKSKLALDWLTFKKQRGLWKRCLIVSPKSVISHWMDEIKKHSDFKADYVKSTQSGFPDTEIVVVNYRKLVLMGIPEGFDAIVLDESFMIKNKSRRTKSIINQSINFKLKLLLSGPVFESYLDYFYQLYFISPRIIGMRSLSEFKRKFCLMGGYLRKQILGYRNIPVLLNRISPFVYVMKKSDVKDFRKQIFIRKFVSLKEYPDIYKAMKDLKRELATELIEGQKIRISGGGAKLSKILQLPSGFIYVNDDGNGGEFTHFFKRSPKLELLVQVLSELDSNSKKLIWFKFKGEKELFQKYFKDPLIIDGSTSIEKRKEILDEYERRNLIFVQIDSSKFGVEIPADYVIYFSNTFSFITRKQSEARSLRVTTKEDVTYIDLESEPDRKIRSILEKKGILNTSFSNYMTRKIRIDSDFLVEFLEGL